MSVETGESLPLWVQASLTSAELVDLVAGPFTDPLSRTWWPGLVLIAVMAAVYAARTRTRVVPTLRALAAHSSTHLDVQLLVSRQLVRALFGGAGISLAYTIATRGVLWADHTFGAPAAPAWPLWLITAVYTVTLFVAWDASRFILHGCMHRVPALWAFHQVHHSAEHLTPLTFHRIHPLESALYRLRGGLVTGVVTGGFYWMFREQATTWTWLGVPAMGVLLNTTLGNLRHSAIPVRFPAIVERWILLSPAQHQLHHSTDPQHHGANFGTWIPWWDRLAGSFHHAVDGPLTFGVPAAERNHEDHLLSAWLGPFRALLPTAAPLALLLAGSLGLPAQADDAQNDDSDGDRSADDDSELGTEIIVYSADKTPRVAGAAQRVDEDTLEQFEYDDIERVLAQVPGVNTRSEDGYGLRPNIGIRGVNSDRSAKVTLLEDGIPLAPAPYAAPAAYYFPMTTRITGVEVFKGAAATRFGPQTVAGAINLTTRDVPTESLWELDLAGGMRTTGRVHAFVGDGTASRGWLVEGVHLQTAGFKELDTGGPTGFNRTELMAKGRMAVGDDHRLGLKLGYSRELSNETYTGLTPTDFAENPYRRYAATALGQMDWNRTQAEASWSVTPSSDLAIRTVAYHHWMERSWFKFNRFGADGLDAHALLQQDPTTGQGAVYMGILRGEEDSTTPEQSLFIGTNDRRFHAYGVQTALRWTGRMGAVRHTLDSAVRLHGDHVKRLHTEEGHDMTAGRPVRNDTPLITNLDSVATAYALSAHVHEDFRWKKLHLLPGVRTEVIRTERIDEGTPALAPITRTIVLPGVGGMVDLAPSWSVFGGSYRGFSPVPPGEDAAVQPEQSWNHEAGTRVVFADFQFDVVGFLNEYSNLTGQCTMSSGCDDDALGAQFNGGRARVRGLESSLKHILLLPGAFSLPIQGSYTYTQGQFRTAFESSFPQFGQVDVGDYLPYVPQHQGYGRVTLAHERFDLGVGVAYRSEMLDAAGQYPATPLDIPELVLIDGGFRVMPTERITVYANGTNLANKATVTSWRPLGARPVAPRQVMVGLELRSR